MLSSTVRGVIIRSVNQNQIHLYSKRVRTDIPKKIIKSKTPKKLQKSSVVRSRKFTKNKLFKFIYFLRSIIFEME